MLYDTIIPNSLMLSSHMTCKCFFFYNNTFMCKSKQMTMECIENFSLHIILVPPVFYCLQKTDIFARTRTNFFVCSIFIHLCFSYYFLFICKRKQQKAWKSEKIYLWHAKMLVEAFADINFTLQILLPHTFTRKWNCLI